jgi:dTDP-4-amino-4,6-dideoxygalactose transaminase
MSNESFIDFNRPSIGEDEIAEVTAVLKSGWLTTGPRTAQFEREFKAYVRAPHALAVNSCTAGLHLALAASRIGPGDEVITTPLTFCATVNTILQVGATPVLADVDETGNLDPAEIARLIGPRTRAIVPVHLAGLPCDMQAIWGLARAHGLAVIEDAAHAVGARYQDQPIGGGNPASGACSNAVAFSFYATKNLTTGEGGMVTTHDARLFESMQVLCLHGIDKQAWSRYTEQGNWYYEVVASGFKYNLSDIQAALGIHQLRKLESFLDIRTHYARIFHAAFADVEEIERPPDCVSADCRNAWHLYMVRLRLERLDIARAEVIRELKKKGIGTSVHFIPIPIHPYFSARVLGRNSSYTRALALYPRLISLPLYPAMSEEQIHYVADALKTVLRSARKSKTVAARSLRAAV